MRITVTLDDATHERLVEWATADRRSVAGTAAMLIEFALTNDENALLRVPEVIEEGRRLASQRDDLIGQGVPSSDLAVPLHPMDSEDRSAAGDGGWSTKVVRAPEPAPSKPLPPTKKEKPVSKTKGCQHLHTRYRMGRQHCTDCGDLL